MTTHGASGNFDPQGSGPSNAIAFPNIYQLFGSAANATVQNIWNSLDAWAASQAGSGLSAGALKTIYEVRHFSLQRLCTTPLRFRDLG